MYLVLQVMLTLSFSSEVNLKLLSSLEITPKKAIRSMSGKQLTLCTCKYSSLYIHIQADRSTTLAELFVSTYGRAEIPSALSGCVSSLTTPLHPHWGELAPLITRTLLKALYPTLNVLSYCVHVI